MLGLAGLQRHGWPDSTHGHRFWGCKKINSKVILEIFREADSCFMPNIPLWWFLDQYIKVLFKRFNSDIRFEHTWYPSAVVEPHFVVEPFTAEQLRKKRNYVSKMHCMCLLIFWRITWRSHMYSCFPSCWNRCWRCSKIWRVLVLNLALLNTHTFPSFWRTIFGWWFEKRSSLTPARPPQ